MSLSFDSQFASFRCLSGLRNPWFRFLSARARETTTRLNEVILSYRPDSCQASFPFCPVFCRVFFTCYDGLEQESRRLSK